MHLHRMEKCIVAALLAVVGVAGCGRKTMTAQASPTPSPQQIEQEIRSDKRIPEAAKERLIQDKLREQQLRERQAKKR